jgi:L-ascorbate metabolism protein UlaG (beta-lactamase superfamily)
LEIVIAETILIVDPFIRPNKLAAEIDITTLHADYILLTHAHQDHVADVSYFADQGAVIISNFPICNHYQTMDYAVNHMNHG